MEPADFWKAYALIFAVELPGKTTFASMLLATRARPAAVFCGAAAAFALHTAIAVAAGGFLAFLPARGVKAAAGLLFLGMALWSWRRARAAHAPEPAGAFGGFAPAAGASFALVFAAQWGDPSQLATAALAADPASRGTVALAATAALWSVTALAVAAGRLAGGALEPRRVGRWASVALAAVGAALLWGAAR